MTAFIFKYSFPDNLFPNFTAKKTYQISSTIITRNDILYHDFRHRILKTFINHQKIHLSGNCISLLFYHIHSVTCLDWNLRDYSIKGRKASKVYSCTCSYPCCICSISYTSCYCIRYNWAKLIVSHFIICTYTCIQLQY